MLPVIAILGEVLVDVFPEQAIIGGAPYNVARHCHAFGLQTHFLSAVGQDAQGARILREMHACGLAYAGVQQHASLPTGQVLVHFSEGSHRFEILDRQAYDAMLLPPLLACVRQSPPGIAYIGTLALRHPHMQQVAQAWLAALECAVFCDINLRAPWYEAASLQVVLQAADFLKINHEELPEVLRVLGLRSREASLPVMARQLLEAFAIREAFVTCGAQGSLWVSATGEVLHAPSMVLEGPFVDSVGAGDAYSAMVLRGLLAGWARPLILQRAAQFATAVCGIRGAVPATAAFYQSYL